MAAVAYQRVCAGLVAAALMAASGGRAAAEQVSVHLLPSEDAPATTSELRAGLALAAPAQGLRLVDGISLAREGYERDLHSVHGGGALEEVARLRAEGWRAYLEARATFAADKLSAARGAALPLAFLPEGRRELAELALALGAVKLELGQAADAADEFRLAKRLVAELQVRDTRFKPEVVEAYTAAIADERPRQRVRVSLEPETASLWVNGTRSRAEGLELEDGLHLLAWSAPGFRLAARLVSVSPGEERELSLRLDADPIAQDLLGARELLARGQSQGRMHEVLEALGSHAGSVEFLFLTSVWRRQAPALLYQRCAGSPLRCSSVAELGYGEGGLQEALEHLAAQYRDLSLRALSPSLQVDERLLRGEARPRPHRGRDKPVWKNPWLWVGVSALAVVGGAVLLSGAEDSVVPSFGGRSCDFGGCP